MDLIPEFIARKHGSERWDYLDPRLEPILDPTYGIMVYQEQVMQIAQVIGGYTLGGADLLRRAMGKKKPEEMAKQREIFLAGADAARPRRRARPTQLFDLMEKFAGYGFNKSHAAAYALVAYQTAYLKAHHPAAFMAANMSAVMDDTDKVQVLYDDAVKGGLASTAAGRQRLRATASCRWTRSASATGWARSRAPARRAIAAHRGRARGGRRLPGPVRLLPARRPAAWSTAARSRRWSAPARSTPSTRTAPACSPAVGNAIEAAEKREQYAAQVSLFGGGDGPEDAFEMVQAPAWGERERLRNEKQSLGFYLSGHPFHAYRDELRRFARTALAHLVPGYEPVMLAGVIYGVNVRNSRRGRMAILTLDDGTARVDVVVYGELFQEKRAVIQEDQVVVVRGKVFNDDFSGGVRITADQILDLAEVRSAHARLLRLSINGQADGARLKSLLAQYGGGQCQVAIRYRNASGECDIRLPEACRVKVSAPLLDSLAQWLDERNVEVVY